MEHSRQHVHRSALTRLCVVLGLALVCPDLALATDAPVTGGGGGNYFRAECPKGSYLVGLDGRAGEWVDRIAPVCAPWLRGSQTFGAPSIGQSFGTSGGGQERHPSCWGSGVKTLAVQSWYIDTLRSENRFVQYIEAHCISLAPPASKGFWDFGSKSASAEERLTSGPYGSTGPGQACPDGEVAVGIHGRAGLFVDAVGLICGPLPTKFGAPVTKVIPDAVSPSSVPATTVNPLMKAPAPSDDMFTIIRPAPGDRVQQGQLIVAATPPKVGMTSVTELELKWLDAPPNLQHSYPYTTTFAVDTSTLLQGYSVAQIVTGGYAGRWQVRARASMKAVPGPWSFPVQFHLFLTQPTQSQSPIIPQSPLPSSSIVQPPSQGGSTAMPSQAPGALKGMIRSRGVEGEQPAEPAPETTVPAEQPTGTKPP